MTRHNDKQDRKMIDLKEVDLDQLKSDLDAHVTFLEKKFLKMLDELTDPEKKVVNEEDKIDFVTKQLATCKKILKEIPSQDHLTLNEEPTPALENALIMTFDLHDELKKEADRYWESNFAPPELWEEIVDFTHRNHVAIGAILLVIGIAMASTWIGLGFFTAVGFGLLVSGLLVAAIGMMAVKEMPNNVLSRQILPDTSGFHSKYERVLFNKSDVQKPEEQEQIKNQWGR